MSAVEQLGERLRAAGFGGRPASDVLAGHVIPPVDSLVALGRSDDALTAVLLKLFRKGHTIDRAQAERALAPVALDDLVDACLMVIDGSRVRARLQLSQFGGLILAGDPTWDAEARSHVAPLTQSSGWVAHLTVRRKISAALDLGTGSGIHALFAARHAERVVGVDINAHALAIARLSERLNPVANHIDWVEGNWIEVVHDRRFDLVVANPPWVISPDNALLYRDDEAVRDEVSREVVRGCSTALAEGGFATVMCNWIHREGQWDQPISEWVTGLGCDALLLHHASFKPLQYALSWSTHLVDDPEVFDETVNRWASHYSRSGMERLATGFVILRRRSSGSNWIQAFEGVGMPQGEGGEHIERMFAAGDFLHSCTGARQLGELLSRRWQLLKSHCLKQSAIYADGAYVGEGRMSLQPDMGVDATFDPRVLPVLLGCDGRRTLGEVIEETAIPADLDRSGFHSLCLTSARHVISRGYLVEAA
ncbi:MAG: methyltransferase [Solirubrobacteraceae bacterium]